MSFVLSKSSLSKLEGVDERLVQVVREALRITSIDFSVYEGLRSYERQLALFKQGLTEVTDEGKHLIGHAVDLYAWDGQSRSSLEYMGPVAEAMKYAAGSLDVKIRWGGAWHIPNIVATRYSMAFYNKQYNDLCDRQGRKAFNDFPHFEIS